MQRQITFLPIAMRVLILSGFLLIALTHVCIAAGIVRGPGGPGGEPPVFDCSGKVGYFADLWKNCEVYYYCREDGTKLTFSCPNQTYQTYFDEAAQNCVQHYKCPDPEPIPPTF
ncbi:uncharacterized protein LOC130696787 [Daphnia carinata]|uniref:uncharacterized protein LOC130696787 n=1 Tax=Daphnia carinata TaxID=120202 RepID=UPI00257D51B9|nr:uncharacterized protein LOC130696787 [Daphnia carinata]